MANSLPSWVHTTGNETIAGVKTLTSALLSKNMEHTVNEAVSGWTWIGNHEIRDKNGARMGELRTIRRPTGDTFINQTDIIAVGSNGAESRISVGVLDNGNLWATAPTTPSGATGTEIATADWVITKINEMATKNGLAGL